MHQTYLVYDLFQDVHGQVQQLQRFLNGLLFPLWRMLHGRGCCGCADSNGHGKVARPGIVSRPLCRDRVRIVRRGRERLGNVLLEGRRRRGPGTTGSGERRSHVAVVELGACHGRQRVERPHRRTEARQRLPQQQRSSCSVAGKVDGLRVVGRRPANDQ